METLSEIEADALAVGGIVEAARHTPGNAAAHAMTLDEAIAHAEDVADRCDTSCGREHRQLAEWLKELRDVKSQHVGNAAAMREALVLALDALISWLNGTIDRTTNRETIKAIRAALAAPARNCDLRYYNNATIDECSARAFVDHLRYCEKYGACSNCPIHSENGSCLAKYLLSPAEGGAS